MRLFRGAFPVLIGALATVVWAGSHAEKKADSKMADSKMAVTMATIGEKAPGFTLTDQNGESVSLSDFAEQVVVLEWINCDCPYVKRHYKAGTMKTLAQKYQEQGVVWLAINSTHYADGDGNKNWVETHELPYRILEDKDGAVGKAYNARTTPHMFVIDGQGVLVFDGPIDDSPRGGSDNPLNYVDQALQEVLAGQAVSVPKGKPYGCSVKYAS